MWQEQADTSWSQVEKFRSTSPVKRIAAEAFSDWGIPTVECITSVRDIIGKQPIIASGGIHTGVDGAKAIAIGADIVGFGRSILKEATLSTKDVLEAMETRELELRMAMFGIGVASLRELKKTDRVSYQVF